MYKKALTNLLLLFWVTLCIAFFIAGPGRRSGIHLFPLEDQSLNRIFSQITEINFLVMFTDILKSFIYAAFFVLSAIGLGWLFIKSIDRNGVTTEEGGRIIITAFMLGQSLFIILFLILLILFQYFLPKINFLILLAGFIYVFFHSRQIYYYIRDKAKEIISLSIERYLIFPVILSIIVFGCALLYSSSRLGYDAASQYLHSSKIDCSI